MKPESFMRKQVVWNTNNVSLNNDINEKIINLAKKYSLIDNSQFSQGVSLFSPKKLGLADRKMVLIC